MRCVRLGAPVEIIGDLWIAHDASPPRTSIRGDPPPRPRPGRPGRCARVPGQAPGGQPAAAHAAPAAARQRCASRAPSPQAAPVAPPRPPGAGGLWRGGNSRRGADMINCCNSPQPVLADPQVTRNAAPSRHRPAQSSSLRPWARPVTADCPRPRAPCDTRGRGATALPAGSAPDHLQDSNGINIFLAAHRGRRLAPPGRPDRPGNAHPGTRRRRRRHQLPRNPAQGTHRLNERIQQGLKTLAVVSDPPASGPGTGCVAAGRTASARRVVRSGAGRLHAARGQGRECCPGHHIRGQKDQ